MSPALERYVALLDELLLKRAIGKLDDDTEESLVVALSDCRPEMSAEEEAQIEGIVDQRKAIFARLPENSGK